jgi:selenocysteine-specific elongation factor
VVRRVVVGTAGHIDHGKTALVLALTGVDTDRWAEEKRRGITIDLGFAPFDLGAGLEASIVDVPGHEGFVRNMLAGATGIDLALLVIAADEGVMPQTEEHLAILELLGVGAGIPVLTKADAVDAEWLELVRSEAAARLARSRIRWAPPVVTSAVTGQGLDDLRSAVRDAAAGLEGRTERDLFRLPIDRSFAVPGAGTVVTGTTWSGTVAVGDAVRLLPLDREVRVRSIEVHGAPAERAVAGRRTALALVGVRKDEVRRGHVAVTGPGWRGSSVLEAEVELLAAARPLANRARVRVHLGTAEVLARVVLATPLAPGGRGVARFVLETPLVARGGDRFVLRGYSPVTTIGGGVVTDPFPVTRRGRATSVTAARPPVERLLAWLGTAGLAGLATDDLPVRLGLAPEAAADVVAGAGKAALAAGGLLVARTAAAAAAEGLGAVLDRHHRDRPLEPGMSLQALRATLTAPAGSPAAAVADLVCALAARKRILEVDGALARRPDWRPALDGAAGDQRSALAARLAGARWEVPTVAELERDLPGVPVRALLANLARGGGVEPIDQERYADTAALLAFRAALEAALTELGQATPAQLRERFGLTRKYLIPLLEWADRRGITRRSGDARILARLTA